MTWSVVTQSVESVKTRMPVTHDRWWCWMGVRIRTSNTTWHWRIRTSQSTVWTICCPKGWGPLPSPLSLTSSFSLLPMEKMRQMLEKVVEIISIYQAISKHSVNLVIRSGIGNDNRHFKVCVLTANVHLQPHPPLLRLRYVLVFIFNIILTICQSAICPPSWRELSLLYYSQLAI